MPDSTVERYVQNADAELAFLDRDGFLDLTAVNDVKSAVRVAGQPGSFVLLAAGGAGKSALLDDLCGQEDGVAVDLVGLRGLDIGREIGAAAASGRPVYLDSLDEALLTEPALARLMSRAMSDPGAIRVPWRLACRPSAWTGTFVDGVRGVEKLRLLPITREGARRLLESINVDEGFLDALAAAGQSRLSASLLHFIAAARQWQVDGRLPGRRVELLESEIQHLLAEREEVRPPLQTAIDVRRPAAGRLALFTAFSGAGRFTLRTGASRTAVASADLPSVPEPDRPDTTIGRGVYDEVLGSALFDYAPGDAVAFRHQDYVDYLAAKYAVGRSPVRAQVADLLGLTDGVLPGARTAVAAWMVALDAELAEVVAPANAIALIESGVDLPPIARSTVVDALLADARDGDLPPLWSLDVSTVVHAGLESQLTDRLATAVESPFEAWWACRLGLAGQLAAVVPVALQMALDARFPSWTRRAAIAVVTNLGTERERSALLARLILDRENDRYDELRAGLLDGLYPNHMTTAQLLPFLKRPPLNFLGAYHRFLDAFATRIPDADLPEALFWAQDIKVGQSFESRRWASDVAVKIVAQAFAVSNDPVVLEQAAALLITLAGNAGVRLSWSQDSSRRQRMALAVAAQLEERRWSVLLQLNLVSEDGITWLTETVRHDSAAGQPVLARCLERLTAPPTTADEEQEHEDDPDPQALKAAIAAARQDLATWADIPIALALEHDVESLFDCDLASRPGWNPLSAENRQEIIARGLEYVVERSPDASLWAGKTSISYDVIRAWSGVYLLTTVAHHTPQLLTGVPLTVWTRWASAIADAWIHRSASLLRDLVELAPAEAKAEIRGAVQKTFAERAEWRRTPLYEYFAQDLAPALAGGVVQRRYPDDQNADGLDFLIEQHPKIALATARAVAHGDGTQLSRVANRYLAKIDSIGTIDRLLSGSVPDGVFGELLEGLVLDTVDDRHLAALTALLIRRFPISDDDRLDAGWSFESPFRRGTQVRNHAVETLASRGLVTELKTLAEGLSAPESALIRYYLRPARQVAADRGHFNLSPNVLLDLLGHTDLRLIRDSADLTNVLRHHLDELQHELTRNGGFRDLWSPDGKDLGSEDDITDWVRRRLRERFGPNRIILAREPQVERLAVKGSGTRIDLAAAAPTNTAPAGHASVTIEAKLFSNAELRTALRQQLVDQYLRPTGQRRGIYLVYWIPAEQRKSANRKYPDREELLDDMRRWAAEVAPQYEVSVYLLDVSWPKPKS